MSILKLELHYLKICAIQGYYAAHSGKFLPTFRDKLSVPYSEKNNLLLLKNYFTYSSVRMHVYHLCDVTFSTVLI